MCASVFRRMSNISRGTILTTTIAVSLSFGAYCQAESWDGKVRQHGEMRQVLGLGQHEGRIQLRELKSKPHCVAVGALAHLAGEITILDGQITISRVGDNGKLRTQTAEPPLRDEKAAMLAAAHVPEWTSHAIPHDVKADAVEQYLVEAAKHAGIDPSKPFPFVIEGELVGLEIHVINGACPMRAKRLNLEIPTDKQPYWKLRKKTAGRIVGFYVQDGEHRMTHHGTKTHMHALVKDGDGRQHTGHVERVGILANAKLSLPKQ